MTPEAILDAYYEGFDEGATQQNQYGWGCTPIPVKRCWEDSEAKAELDKRSADRLKRACEIERSWPWSPAWRRQL
jgi:hypothetical protein